MGYPNASKPKQKPGAEATAQRLEALIGERRDSVPEEKAVLRGDAAAMGNITINATHITASPTAANYNALVDDIKALAVVLNQMGAKFNGL